MDKITEKEVQNGMTNRQAAALVEAIKKIVEIEKGSEKVIKALDDIQGQLNGTTSK